MTRLPLEYAARNLGRSRVRLVLSVLAAAIVVALVAAAGSFVRGLDRSLRSSGDPRNVIMLGIGSEESLERSEIPPSAASLIGASVPGVRTTLDQSHVSPEVHVALPVATAPDASGLVLVRGVTPTSLLVHGNVQLVEGRFPRSGQDEVMLGRHVGSRLGLQEADLAVGATILIDKRPWTIVGRFIAPGSALEAEIWTDLGDLKTATKRTTDSCVVVTLAPEGEFGDLDAFARQRLDLELAAMPETEYYARLGQFYAPIRAGAWVTAGLIAAGALFGGLNTLYAAFAGRTRELAMLRCLGFRRSAIAFSLVQESLLAAAAGALIGCAVSLMILDGRAVSFSTGAFELHIDVTVLALALAAGLALGLAGALPPAARALRQSIPQALKAA